jgi:hypothetical protein
MKIFYHKVSVAVVIKLSFFKILSVMICRYSSKKKAIKFIGPGVA